MTVQADDAARAPGVALDDDARERGRKALLAMLAEAPVHRIAMRDAAKRAGMGLATLYKYFGGKEAMVASVVEPDLEALIDALSAASRREIGVKARFRAVVEANLSFVRDHREAARAVMVNLPAGVWGADETAWTQRRRAVLVHILKNGMHDGSVRSDMEPEALADLVFGALDRAVERTLLDGEDVDPSRLGAGLFAALWPAVSAD